MRKSAQAPRSIRASVEDNDSRPVAMITLTQIVKTHVPIRPTSGHEGLTYGELLDQQLLMAAHEGRIIQEISFGFEESDWNDFAENLRHVEPNYEHAIPVGWESTEG